MREDDPEIDVLLQPKPVLSNEADILRKIKTNKMRISINLDRDIIDYFKLRGSEAAKGYQTLINDVLRNYVGLGSKTDILADLIERVKRLEEKLLLK